jgi:transcriptional regulator with XRE-family HTH domain
MTQRNNVLLPIPLPTQSSLRRAVAGIIRGVQLDLDLTDEEMADEIGVSAGTIGNARNEKADLNAATIARIGHRYGVERLDPYAALYGARNVPIQAEDADALPSLSGAVHRLAVAQSPASPGGAAVNHTELLDMLPELRAAQQALNALICRAERIAA